MPTYIAKRLLLMIPTFFAISLIVFVVLNFAPGRPGGAQAGAGGEQDAVSAEARESYQIFKEQFNFDKPILFNTRFALSQRDIVHLLVKMADYQKPVCERLDAGQAHDCVPQARRAEPGAVIEAQEQLEDWGNYAVPGLIAVAQDHERRDVRIRALEYLRLNAKRRLHNVYGRRLSDQERAYNQEVDRENQTIDSWRISSTASTSEIDQLVQDKWAPWLAQHSARFEYSLGRKVSVFFTDTRFAKYWANLIQFDFGVSHIDKQPVLQTILGKLRYSVTLGFSSVVLAYLISVPLGIWSAYRQNTVRERVVTIGLFMLYSLPSFFVAVLLLQYLTVGEPLDWFPSGSFVGRDADQMTTLEYLGSVAWHMVLPILCLTYGALASLSRYARGGLLDVIRADYIRTARAKGLSEPMVVVKHAARNGMIPILTLLGSLLPTLIGGSVIIEYIFSIPGMGSYLFESIQLRDYNAIMGVLLISSVLTLVGFLISDISYAVVDPRITFD